MSAPRPKTRQESETDAGIVASGRAVLETEAAALVRLAGALPPDFAPAVRRILALEGRVIVSGIGKSGHVARKIAATLASTGTPALFVHPSEASHGDLGMIGAEDLCLLLSNSGETAELRDLVAYARRFAIPLVAMTRAPDSTLARAADLCLTLPDAPEACAIGMAPTTSTTLAMGLGDALAVALMRARGFDPERFHVFHPGGKLGAQMMRVGELMHGGAELPLVGTDTPMSETLLVMTAKGFGIAVVVDGEGRLAGVVTDGDLRRNMDGLTGRSAGAVANPDPVTVTPATLAADALAILNARRITALLAVDEARRPVGVFNIHDLLRAGVA